LSLLSFSALDCRRRCAVFALRDARFSRADGGRCARFFVPTLPRAGMGSVACLPANPRRPGDGEQFATRTTTIGMAVPRVAPTENPIARHAPRT